METLIVKDRDMVLRIGKIVKVSDRNMVNVYTNFNPIKKLTLIDMIGSIEPVKEVSNVSRYDEESGGFALELKKGKNEMDLHDSLISLLKQAIL